MFQIKYEIKSPHTVLRPQISPSHFVFALAGFKNLLNSTFIESLDTLYTLLLNKFRNLTFDFK